MCGSCRSRSNAVFNRRSVCACVCVRVCVGAGFKSNIHSNPLVRLCTEASVCTVYRTGLSVEGERGYTPYFRADMGIMGGINNLSK